MKAVVFHGVGDIRVDDVPEPTIQDPTDAIIRVTRAAICGTDLHMIRGTETEMVPGTILGHEAVGVVEQVGPEIKEMKVGDRVVVSSSLSCGTCENCQRRRFDLCLRANPNGPRGLAAFLGGTKQTGPFNGVQAEKARIPFADTNLVKIPDEVTDDQAVMLSDLFPTGYYAAERAQIQEGNTVAVFGCGPVGLFSIISAQLKGAGRIFAVDTIASRLAAARGLGAEVIDYNVDDPVATIMKLTDNIGADRVIDAVGIDANRPHQGGIQHVTSALLSPLFKKEDNQVASESNPQGDNFHPGDAPGQALMWEALSIAKAGTLAVIGVYTQPMHDFPLGILMNKNVTVVTGHCPQRAYIPYLLELVRTGAVDPAAILTQEEPITEAIEAYKAFDTRQPGWLKVALEPVTSA
jgi:threonine dehydrogenase-like Zn-dependent dehydrogenase